MPKVLNLIILALMCVYLDQIGAAGLFIISMDEMCDLMGVCSEKLLPAALH